MKRKTLLFLMLMALFAPLAMNAQSRSTLTVYGDNTTTNEYVPIYGYWADSKSKCEFIIPKEKLSVMTGGRISAMKFYLSNSGSSNQISATFNVFVKEVSATTLTGFTGTDNATTVFNNTITIAANASNVEFDIPFSSDYIYNGGNLLVGFYQTGSTSYNHTYWTGETQSTNTSWSGYGTQTGSGQKFLPKTTFTYVASSTPYISLNPNTATVFTGFTQTLTATYGNVSGTPTITYSSSNTSVATVTGSGTTATVTAVAPGTATITATMNGSYTGTCAITVENPSYCTPSFSSTSDYITNFTLGEIGNSTDFSSNGYGDYTNQSASLEPGVTATASLTSSSGSGTHAAAIWIDFNDNYVFESSERVGTQDNIGASSTVNISLAIPSDAAVGNHRLRVVYQYSVTATNINPCASASFGEGEDYTVVITSFCPKPTNLTVTDITNNHATVTWDKQSTQEEQTVYFQFTWVAHGTAVNWTDAGYAIDRFSNSNLPSGSASGLTPETEYDFYVRRFCGTVDPINGPQPQGDGDFSTAEMVTFTTAASTCPKPTNLTVSNLTPTSATLNWEGEAESYNVRYGMAGGDVTIFEDGFENGLDNWTIISNGEYTGTTWRQFNVDDFGSEGLTNHNGSYVTMSRSYAGSSVGDVSVDNWLITPQVALDGDLKYWVINDDGADYAEQYAIYVSTTGNSISDFTLLYTPQNNSTTWTEHVVDLRSYNGTLGYIAIRHNDYGKDFLVIDDFGIYATQDAGEWINATSTTNSLDITGLTPETNYVFQVQAVCGAEGESSWSDIATFSTPDGCAVPSDLAAEVTGNAAELSWTGVQEYYNVLYREVDPTVPATIILNIPTDVWGDGSGYQMLIDADATAYGTIIPETGGLTASGDASAETYAEFEYKLPTNADGSCTTTNILVTGSISIEIPAGTYDWCITNPTPDDRIWIASSNGNVGGRQDDYVFEPGMTYEFTVSLIGQNDGVDVTITDNNTWTLVEGVNNPYTLENLSAQTTYKYKVQGLNCDGNGGTTDWSASANFTTPEAYTVTLNSWPESIDATLTGDGLQSVGSLTITAEAPSGYQFVNWTGTDGNVVSSYANYTFNLTGDITLQANFTMTTTTSLPWTEGFESYTYSGQGLLNGDWATPLRVGSCPNVENYPWGAPSGSYAMHMDQNSSNYSMAVFPQFDQPLNTLLVEFTCARGGDGTTGEGVLGYVTDPSDGSTFVALATMTQPNSVDSYSSYSYNLTTISNAPDNANYRLAIRYKNSGQVWFFDDFSVKVATHTLTASVSPSEGGTISDNGTTISGNVEYNDGTSVTLTANAATGYTFQNWTIDGSTVANNPTTITMDQDHTVVANFTLNQYTVSVSANPSEGGTVAGGNTYSHGVTATLTATANTGYTFVNWTKNGIEVSIEATYSFTVTEAGEYVANFEANLYTLTVAADPTHAGSVTVDPAGTLVPNTPATYTVGTAAVQRANAPCGRNYTFVEMVYTKTELGSAGSISSIAFHHASGEVGQQIEVYMMATTESSLSTYIPINDAVLVRSSYILTTPDADGWVTIPLSTTFNWDGNSNLLVAVNKTNLTNQQGTASTYWYNTESINSILFSDSNSQITPTNPSPIANVVDWRPQIQFTITPASTTYQYAYGTEVALTATANSGYYFYNWTDGSNNAYTVNPLNVTVTEDMAYTAHFVNYKRFVTNGSWDNGNNWSPTGAPDITEDVSIEAAATIPNGCVATANEITINGGSITIQDGGQLQHNNSGVTVTTQKSITGYGNGNANTNKGYYLISSPVDGIAASNVTGLQTSQYDLYKFVSNNEENGELLEWVHVNGNLEAKTGYIYASEETTALGITGTVAHSATNIQKTLTYNEGYRFGGWNLIGNPFVCNAYVNVANYYILNHQSGYDEFVATDNSHAIAPMSGLMVVATATGQSVTYSRTAPSKGSGILNIDVNRAMDRGTATLDRARIRFGEGEGLEKFQLNPNHTKVYIPEGGNDYAVYYAEGAGTIPVNFKAQDNGRYTLDFSTEDVGFNYLHLIDNMNGNDVDLLQTPYYAFDAKSTDFASRFTLAFATGNDNDGNFAFFNNGVWIINNDGKAELQVVDALGRILSSENISGSTSKAINVAPGVYMLRLINGNDVKVQKVVVRR